MFGFGTQALAAKTSRFDEVVKRHKEIMAAERAPAVRSDTPAPVVRKNPGFGKRR